MVTTRTGVIPVAQTTRKGVAVQSTNDDSDFADQGVDDLTSVTLTDSDDQPTKTSDWFSDRMLNLFFWVVMTAVVVVCFYLAYCGVQVFGGGA